MTTTIMGSAEDDGPVFRYVQIELITIDLRVQQPADKKRMQKMAANFMPKALSTVTLSERADGSLIALDGQHRIGAAKFAGYRKPIAALVYRGLSLQQEGEMFLDLNNTKVPTPVSKFKVGVAAGDLVVCAIHDIVTKSGWEIERFKGAGKLTAVAALRQIYDGAKVGSKRPERADLVEATLTTITAAWGHDGDGVMASLLLGVASLYARYGARLDSSRLVEKMSASTPRDVLANGAQARAFLGGTEYAGVSRWLVKEYNKGLRKNPLPDWQWLK